jgi:hypothetical protein
MSVDVKAGAVDQRLVGIRGWLILPAIGMAASPILGVLWLIFGLGPMEKMIDYGFGGYVFPRVILNIGLLIYTCIAAARFFKKQSNAPRTVSRLLIARAIASFAVFVIGMVVIGGDDAELAIVLLKENNFIAQGLAAAVWIPYFRISLRVKATFVN